MSILNSNNFLYKTVDGVKQFFSPLVNASTVVLKDGSRLEKDGKIYATNAVNAENSAMFGGKEPKYYIQPRNLLDNSDFTNPVNQRGQTSYTTGYTIDRWTVQSTATTILTVDGDGITVKGNGTTGYVFHRILAIPDMIGKTLTAAICLKDGTIYTFGNGVLSEIDVSGEIQIGERADTNNGANLALFIGYNRQIVIQIKVPNNVSLGLKWAALYEGSYTPETLPPYVPKGYAVELAECQRYFERFVANTAWHIFAFGAVTKSGNKATFQFNYAKKRIQSPTLNMSGNFCVIHDGATITPTSWTWSNANDNSMLIDAVITGVTLGKAVYIQARNDTSAYIDISADL